MFLGTNKKFKILYFITSMFPAYLIIFFYVLDNYLRENREYNLCLLILLLFIFVFIFFLLGSKLKRLIEDTDGTSLSTNVKSELIILEEMNGDVISYLLGVIFPSIIIISESSLKINILIFIIIQLSIYILTIRSTSLLPNVFMILFLG